MTQHPAAAAAACPHVNAHLKEADTYCQEHCEQQFHRVLSMKRRIVPVVAAGCLLLALCWRVGAESRVGRKRDNALCLTLWEPWGGGPVS